MLDSIGMVHRKWFPIDIFDVDSKDLCLIWVIALVQEILEFLCVCVIKDPNVARVKLECLIS